MKMISKVPYNARLGPRITLGLSCLAAAITTLPSGALENPELHPAALGIAHVALRMADTDKTLGFYRDFLGLPERFRTNRVPGRPNVYYKKDGSPADQEKEKQGALMLVDLRIGNDQSLELFAGRAEGQPVLYHPALTSPDLEATRERLATQSAAVPPPAAHDTEPLKSFFTRDPGGTEIEIARPREGSAPQRNGGNDLGARLKSIVYHCSADAAQISRFFSDGLGMSVTAESGGIAATATNGDRLEPKSDGSECPVLIFEAGDLQAARLFLENRPNRASYHSDLEVKEADGRSFVELRDPDGVRVLIVQK
jgi:catechol 2,3-dioxygenase-like lactoylglutathione lyase family enzyme